MARVAGKKSDVSTDKKPGVIKGSLDKLRKKFIPTFGEQFGEAKKAGKKEFRSTRDETKKGKLYYHTGTKEEAKKSLERESRRERAISARSEGKQVGLTDFEGAYKTATKAGKKEFTHKGKKYTTRLKGERPDKWMPELSGKTSKKIKRWTSNKGGRVGLNKGGRVGLQIGGFPKIATKGWR